MVGVRRLNGLLSLAGRLFFFLFFFFFFVVNGHFTMGIISYRLQGVDDGYFLPLAALLYFNGQCPVFTTFFKNIYFIFIYLFY